MTETGHFLLIGMAGSGKTTLAAAAVRLGEKPTRVVMFDPVTQPYEDYGTVEVGEGTAGQMVKRVMSKKDGRLLIQLDCFFDYDPTNPVAWMQFWKVKAEILEEVYAGRWGCVVTDSITGMKDAATNQKKFVDMPNLEPGNWSVQRIVTDELEPWTTGTMPMLPCMSITLMHLDEFMVEEQVGKQKVSREKKVILAPGRLKRSIPSKFGEVYRLYWTPGATLEMQTGQRGHQGYECCRSAMGVEDPCEPSWDAIFAKRRKASGEEKG